MNEKLLKKLQTAKTPEELREMITTAGVEVTDEQVKALFDAVNSELPDDALDSVAGGMAGGIPGGTRGFPSNDMDKKLVKLSKGFFDLLFTMMFGET